MTLMMNDDASKQILEMFACINDWYSDYPERLPHKLREVPGLADVLTKHWRNTHPKQSGGPDIQVDNERI